MLSGLEPRSNNLWTISAFLYELILFMINGNPVFLYSRREGDFFRSRGQKNWSNSHSSQENLIYVKKGVINLTVHVISSQRNFIVSVEEE